MVVYEQQGRGGRSDCSSEDFTRVYEACCQGPDRHLLFRDQAMASIQEQDVKRLPAGDRQPGLKMTLDIERTANRPTTRKRLLQESLTQFERRSETRRLRGSKARDRLDRRAGRRGETVQSAESMDQRPSQIQGRTGAIPRSNNKGQKFRVRECTGSEE
jgi:hypothetical protein